MANPNTGEEKKLEKHEEELKAELDAARAELEGMKGERDAARAELVRVTTQQQPSHIIEFLKMRIPELFNFDAFPVNKKQNMAIHKEFVREALGKLLKELETPAQAEGGMGK